jgi:predicted ATPase/DNA-binding winged helix-turn-helix (wHTH) protein
MEAHPREALAFGRFRALTRQRQLLADGTPVELGSRAFDLLMVLLEARGALVTKDQLLNRVWPGTVVEENNIQVQISALRRVFGEDRNLILTVPLRGYRFTGDIQVVTAADGVTEPASGTASPPARIVTNLPSAVSDFIGRREELQELTDLINRHRLVTIVGSGGIGKTRLALELGLSLLPQFENGVWRAQLAPLNDPELVANATTTALGLQGGAGQWPPERRAAALQGKRILLVLDNCEHVAAAAASEAELLLHAVPTLKLLATSQEPLGVEGECVYRLQPFAVPELECLECETALKNDAVRLFMERARAADPHFVVDDKLASLVATICRRLDGIPLAIELAAARAATLGIEELARRLDDRFRLLTGGSRTALPRHQTLRATLDWSHRLLSQPAQIVVRRLAVFSSRFTLDYATQVVSDESLPSWEVVDHLAELVNRSLVIADSAGSGRRYRMLQTTRAYALEKLADSGEAGEAARRQAQTLCGLFPEAVKAWESLPITEWTERYVPELDDVRAALDWAFGDGGDNELGLQLAAASFVLWPLAALTLEGRARLEQAIAYIGPETPKATEALLWFGYGFLNAGTPRARALPALRRSVVLYRGLEDPGWLGRALDHYGLNLARAGEVAEGREALEEARTLLAKFSPGSRSYVRCLTDLAIVQMVGHDYDAARTLLDEALALREFDGADRWILRARLYKGNVDYAQGQLARAVSDARELVARCRALHGGDGILGHALCNLGDYLAAGGAFEEARTILREGLPLALASELGSAELASGVQTAAIIAFQDGKAERAAELIGYADAFFASEFTGRHPARREARHRLVEALKDKLSPDRLAARMETGSRWSEDQAMAAALDI